MLALNKIKSAYIFGAFFSLFTLYSHAEVATDATIQEFFVESGQEAQLTAGLQAVLPQLRQMTKNTPDDLFREITRTDKVVSTLTPIYRKYFSEEEMREMIAFYKTPVGSKYAKFSGKIQVETMAAEKMRIKGAVINYQVQKGNFSIDQPVK